MASVTIHVVQAFAQQDDGIVATEPKACPSAGAARALERDDFSSNRHPALTLCFAHDLLRKPLHTFRDHALAARRAQTHLGVIAWSRTGEPELGDWQPAVELVRSGTIPDEFDTSGGVE